MGDTLPSEIDQGVYFIDTGLYRAGLASFYLVRQDNHLAFVDAGTRHSAPAAMALIGALGLTPRDVDYVIPTHVHLDHAGGAGDLMALCPNARLVIHPKGARHMIDPQKLIAGASAVYGEAAFESDFGRLTPIPEERVDIAEDGHEIDLGGRILTFLDTPGHANHHGCIFDARTHSFFTGDTFGIAYKDLYTANGPYLFAPSTPVAFDPPAWLRSIDRLMSHEPAAMYLTHFGRLERPERLADTLRQSVRDLQALALAEERNPADGRGERLKAAVDRLLVEGAERAGCDLPATRIRELLSVDIDLNAQGLEVWLKRRAKNASR